MKKEEKLKINLELLRELIEKSGITYRELSKSLESSASKLNKWVTNQQKTSISMNDLLKLCIILDTPLEYLVDSNTDENITLNIANAKLSLKNLFSVSFLQVKSKQFKDKELSYLYNKFLYSEYSKETLIKEENHIKDNINNNYANLFYATLSSIIEESDKNNLMPIIYIKSIISNNDVFNFFSDKIEKAKETIKKKSGKIRRIYFKDKNIKLEHILNDPFYKKEIISQLITSDVYIYTENDIKCDNVFLVDLNGTINWYADYVDFVQKKFEISLTNKQTFELLSSIRKLAKNNNLKKVIAIRDKNINQPINFNDIYVKYENREKKLISSKSNNVLNVKNLEILLEENKNENWFLKDNIEIFKRLCENNKDDKLFLKEHFKNINKLINEDSLNNEELEKYKSTYETITKIIATQSPDEIIYNYYDYLDKYFRIDNDGDISYLRKKVLDIKKHSDIDKPNLI